MIDPEDLIRRLRELLAKATPGPWRERPSHYREIQGSPVGDAKYGDMVTTFTGAIAKQQGYGKDNVALIVAAVNALPTLLDRIDALTAEMGRFKESLEPSGGTKAAYSDGIEYSYVELDEFGDERTVRRLLEWMTIKEVMAMIRARVALKEDTQ